MQEGMRLHFLRPGKRVLLFVIRDKYADLSEIKCTEKWVGILENIWSEVPKPDSDMMFVRLVDVFEVSARLL